VDRESSRVQAAACFFPFSNIMVSRESAPPYRPGIVLGWHNQTTTLQGIVAPFDFREYDAAADRYELVMDEDRLTAMAAGISPIRKVSSDDPPTLLIHGDADALCPLVHSQELVREMQAAGVPVRLVKVAGKGHGWVEMAEQVPLCADWFVEHLKAPGSGASASEGR
jgi:acetyl esterase/lipase